MATKAKGRPKQAKTSTATTNVAATSGNAGVRVYSYIRFSTPEQAEGDSERRQIEKAQKWAERNGYTFDQSLRADRGLSGFSGAHRKRGNLGKFLHRVESGNIPRGSIIVVEELRRLTREGAYVGFKDTILRIFEADIAIQTLDPEWTFTRAKYEEDLATQLTLNVLLTIAREESKQKSRWAKDKWRHVRDKLANGEMVTTNKGKLSDLIPFWLRVSKANGYEVIPGADKTIVQIFKWYRDHVGQTAIARRLNEQRMWSPGGRRKRGGKDGDLVTGWNRGRVKYVLTNPAVIGTKMPGHMVEGKRVPTGPPIEKYYPNILASHSGLWEIVQNQLAHNEGPGGGGRNELARNLMTGLVRCAYCGGPMNYHDPGKGKGQPVLICENGRHKRGCTSQRIRYDHVENLILNNCTRLKPDKVLPPKGEQKRKQKSIEADLDRIDAIIAEKQKVLDHTDADRGRTDNQNLRDRFIKSMEALTDALAQLRIERDAKVNELQALTQSRQTFKTWQADLETLTQLLREQEAGEDGRAKYKNVDLRLKMQSHLAEFIDHITVYARGYTNEAVGHDFSDGDAFREWFDAVESEAFPEGRRKTKTEQREQQKFVEWALAQRRTNRAKFIRVYFRAKDAYYIDMVPPQSIAGLCDIDPLYREFKRKIK